LLCLASHQKLTTKGGNMQTLKNLRSERGRLSLDDLAARSGLSKTTLWQLKRGRNGPTLRTLEKLARGLGCRVEDLLPDK
jgi:transcriptional regulator with XRE-family HTH domain